MQCHLYIIFFQTTIRMGNNMRAQFLTLDIKIHSEIFSNLRDGDLAYS